MEDWKNEFVIALNQKLEQEEEFLAIVKKRLLEGEGPPLSEREKSWLDLIRLSYWEADKKQQEQYRNIFLQVLKEFEVSWLKKPGEVWESTFISYLLSFFESIELDEQIRENLKTFLHSFSASEIKFSKQIPQSESLLEKDLYFQLQRFRFRVSKEDDGDQKEVLTSLWNDSPVISREALRKNRMVLKSMAETDPSLITLKKIHLLFIQSDCIGEEQRKKSLIQNTFLDVGYFLRNVSLNFLFQETQDYIEGFFHSPEFNDVVKVEEFQNFIICLGFILGKDKERYKQLWEDTQKELQDLQQSQTERKDTETDKTSNLIHFQKKKRKRKEQAIDIPSYLQKGA